MPDFEKAKGVIKKYKLDLDEINKELKQANSSHVCIFNNQLESIQFESVKSIVVMDNPGDEEKKAGNYLVGPAGNAFNVLVGSFELYRDNIIVLNKSSITTNSTHGLNEIYKDGRLLAIFKDEQAVTAKFVFALCECFDVPLMIHGYSNYFKKGKRFIDNEKSNRPLFLFFRELFLQNSKIKEKTHIYHHSSRGNLARQMKKYCGEKKLEQLNFSQYLELGKENVKGFSD